MLPVIADSSRFPPRPEGQSEARSGRPALATLAVAALVGPPLHVSILVFPLALLGLVGPALGDPAILLFLLLAVGFSTADLPTLFHGPTSLPLTASGEDQPARRWGLVHGPFLLSTFWAGLLERSLAVAPVTGWPQACGASLMIAGIAVRASAVLTLGPAFKTEWCVSPGQPLVEHHVYAWIRHPSETGNLAVVLGACLLLESPIATAFLPLLGTSTLLRIRGEERRLAEAHGPRYLLYAGRVKRLVPGIY